MITIFTGAGASKALGFPTTAEFFTTGNGKALQEDVVYKNVVKETLIKSSDRTSRAL